MSLAVWDHSVTFHLIQVNTPRLKPQPDRLVSLVLMCFCQIL